jgi:predicted Zn-dependent peptidase
MSAEEIAEKMYQLACSFNLRAGSLATGINVSGLSENLETAMDIVEELVYNAVGDEQILANLKSDMLKSRNDAKLSQSRCFNALQRYVMYGPEYIRKTTLTDEQIKAITSEELLSKIRDLVSHRHEVLYYGPASEEEVSAIISNHHKVAEDLKPLEKKYPVLRKTDANKVYLAQYDAKQIYYLQYSNRGERLDLEAEPMLTMYNEYFGGGMNAIVFQEMREARGLAYSANARLYNPSHKDDSYMYFAFIATQNDKMKTAIQAFDDIINRMPESENAFAVAKEALTTRLRTERTTGRDILQKYTSDRDLGITEPREKKLYETIPSLTLKDVKATQEEWIKDRIYAYGILGDIKDLDTDYLKTLGPVEILDSKDIFGY